MAVSENKFITFLLFSMLFSFISDTWKWLLEYWFLKTVHLAVGSVKDWNNVAFVSNLSLVVKVNVTLKIAVLIVKNNKKYAFVLLHFEFVFGRLYSKNSNYVDIKEIILLWNSTNFTNAQLWEIGTEMELINSTTF